MVCVLGNTVTLGGTSKVYGNEDLFTRLGKKGTTGVQTTIIGTAIGRETTDRFLVFP